MDENGKPKAMGQVIQIDEARIRDHLGEMVRGTVEEALNAMLDAEADRLCGAGRYERSEGRKDTRAGSYERSLDTKAGKVSLKVPKLRRQTFETAIIERYQRRESSVEEALIEMYLASVSVRRVEDITEALWGTRVSPGTVSNLNKKIYAKIDAWRHRKIEGDHPYVFLDGIVMKRSWAGEVRNVSLLVAIGVTREGYREILGIVEGPKEDKSGWSAFLRHLVDRGLSGVQLIVSDACRGLVESAAEFLPEAGWQRCVVHFYRTGVSETLCIWSSPCGFRYSSGEALAEHYGELILGRKPFSDVAAIFLEAADRQVDQLGRRLVRRKRAPRLDRFPDHAVQAFDGVGRVDDLADRRIEGEERDHFLPCPAPGRGDGRVFRGPFPLESIEFGDGHIGGRSPVDPAQIGGMRRVRKQSGGLFPRRLGLAVLP